MKNLNVKSKRFIVYGLSEKTSFLLFGWENLTAFFILLKKSTSIKSFWQHSVGKAVKL